MTHDDDRAWMERAITLGRKARYWSAPNPAVGCVLLRDGVVLGEGFTSLGQRSCRNHGASVSAGRARP